MTDLQVSDLQHHSDGASPRGALTGAIWRLVAGPADAADLASLHADPEASLALLDDLVNSTEDDLDELRRTGGHPQVIDDFADTVARLRATAARLRPPLPARRAAGGAAPGVNGAGTGTGSRPVHRPDPAPTPVPIPELIVPDDVVLQATWSAGHVVVWAGARGAQPEDNDALATRVEAADGPPSGWQGHGGINLPGGTHAEALAISIEDALGWLVAVAGRTDLDGIGPSLRWLSHVAVEGVRLVARGAVVPAVKAPPATAGRVADGAVSWVPALVDTAAIDALAAAMPGPVVAAGGGDGRATANAVIAAVVSAIVAKGVERMVLPAQPPTATTPIDLADTIIARLDGAPFKAPALPLGDLTRRMDQWSRAVTAPNRGRLVVQLASPDTGGVWLVSVMARVGHGKLMPVDAALRTERPPRPINAEWERLGRLFPAVDRAGVRHRGQVALSQDEAWQFMTGTGHTLQAVGFDVRVPALSRRKATAALRLFTEPTGGTVVGAHQLSNVRWSVLFDDVELSAAEIARLAKQARPLVQSHGRWVEVDRADLAQAAAALAEREARHQMTGAEILRLTMGLDSGGLAGGVVVHGESWATDLVERASRASTELVTSPPGFTGELRTYQAEALAWLGFLDAAELGGCLALDMGLGKTPTVLAHLARTAGDEPALVIAPAAVVGNWAAEARRFTKRLRVLVHHGASRAEASALTRAIGRSDVVITTYATALRDIDELGAVTWGRVILDEAQAIKNAGSDTARELRRLNSRSKVALTGTPIENGLGDLWSILDFTNPGLVGTRAAFISQMAGDGEAALRALNGMLLFRRTKSEPEVAAELPDKIDELDHCTMTAEQIGLYQAVLDELVRNVGDETGERKQGAILAAITALKQICNHPAAYRDDGLPLAGRSGKLARLEELIESVFAAEEKILIFTHFATWGRRLAQHLTKVTGKPITCYDGSLARGVRDRMVADFQGRKGAGAMVLSLKAGGTGLNLTAANHVVLYDRWWNPAIEDQARDRAWRIGQEKTVISHRLVCPGTVDERVEEVVADKRHIANMVLSKSSTIADLSVDQLRVALGLRSDELLAEEDVA